MKKRPREIPPRPLAPEVSRECKVLKSVDVTRFVGQIIDGGATRKRLQIPPIEKPISWVDMTNSHWSNFCFKKAINKMKVGSKIKLTSKVGFLIVEHSLNGGYLSLNEGVRAMI
jgi:hypothetical protein